MMQSVAETLIFTRQTEKLFTEDEKRELIDFLAENPLAGDEIPGTGGVRKVRFAASGRGKGEGHGSSTTTWMIPCRSTPFGLCEERSGRHDARRKTRRFRAGGGDQGNPEGER